jgi:hypothetical protein
MRFAKKDFKYTQLLLVNGYENLMSLIPNPSQFLFRDIRDDRDIRDKFFRNLSIEAFKCIGKIICLVMLKLL